LIELLEPKVGDFQQIEVKEKEKIKPALVDYLNTYATQYNDMIATFIWMQDKLNSSQKEEWRRTIRSLGTICRALDLGFDPIRPPRNWSSGQLVQYLAPIPEIVRKQIDLAEPIFGKQQILIYDPNPEHFRRPKVRDPMAIGFVDLTDQRLHFLVGAWDLAEDLKFIELPKERKSNPVDRSIVAITDFNKHMMELQEQQKQWVQPYVLPQTTWVDNTYINKPEWLVRPSTIYSGASGTVSSVTNDVTSSNVNYTSSKSWASRMIS